MADKLKNGMLFAFGDLFQDIGKWFLLGTFLAGIITAYLSPELIETYLGNGFLSMVAMLLIAVPLYVCATASTPIAAALALKGLSPGAAMVFLLAGPATNAASLTVVTKILGKRATSIYLGTILGCSLIIGVATNWLYTRLGLDITTWVHAGNHGEHTILNIVTAIILLLLILRTMIPQWFIHGGIKKVMHRT